MQNKHGFLLIEIVIGMAIALTISLMLISQLQQTQKARAALDDYVYAYTQAAIIHHQLERDLTTAFAPDIILVPTEKSDTEKNATNSAESKNKQNSQNIQQNKEQDKKTDKPEPQKQKPFEKPFYATEKNNNVSLLTCITTSPLSAYWSNKSGQIKTRLARVIYQLKKDAPEKNSPDSDAYTLYRKEGQNLDFKAYSAETDSHTASSSSTSTTGTTKQDKIHQYPIVKNIKSCTFTYEVVIENKDNKQQNSNSANATPEDKAKDKSEDKNSNNAEKSGDNTNKTKRSDSQQKREYKTFTSWDQEEKDEDQTTNQELKKSGTPEKKLPRLPHNVTVNLVLWNRKRNREFPFTFTYSIAWHDGEKT